MSKQGLLTVHRPIRTQTVSVSGTSAAITNAVGSGIHVIRMVSSTDCHFALGGAPTATTSDPLLPADTVEYIRINEGEKIAFIQNTAAGTAYVTEVSQ